MSEENGNGRSAQWERITYVNLIRVLGGVTELGMLPQEPETPASDKAIARAVKAICGKTVAEVVAYLGGAEKLYGPNPSRRQILEGAVSLRWGCSPNTLRKFKVRTRPPNPIKNHQLFLDVSEFGGVKYDKTGEPYRKTLGKGPDALTYQQTLAKGRDVPRGDRLR